MGRLTVVDYPAVYLIVGNMFASGIQDKMPCSRRRVVPWAKKGGATSRSDPTEKSKDAAHNSHNSPPSGVSWRS